MPDHERAKVYDQGHPDATTAEYNADAARAAAAGWFPTAGEWRGSALRVTYAYRGVPPPQPPTPPPPPQTPAITPAAQANLRPATESDAERLNLPLEFLHEIERITADSLADGSIDLRLSWGSSAEAKALVARLKLMQKQLRLLKRQIRETMTAVRGGHVASRQGVQAGFVASMFGKQSATRDRIKKREQSKAAQAQALAPWSNATTIIDQLLVTLEGSIIDVQANPEGRPQ